MTEMRLLTADERMAEARGAKILIVGRPGVGKTSLLRTLDSTALATTLFVDCEGGDLSVLGLSIPSIRPQTWRDLRDLAALFGGADPSRPANAPYCADHFASVAADPVLAPLAVHRTIFIDSLTQAMRLCRTWAETQPESLSERGRKDPRGMYGLIAHEGVGLLQQFQRDRGRNVVFVAVLERHIDDYGIATWRPQLEGVRTGAQLPGNYRRCRHARTARLRRRQASSRPRHAAAEPLGSAARQRPKRTVGNGRAARPWTALNQAHQRKENHDALRL